MSYITCCPLTSHPGDPKITTLSAQISTGQAGRLRAGQLEYLSARPLPAWSRPSEALRRPLLSLLPQEQAALWKETPGGASWDVNKAVACSRATLTPRSNQQLMRRVKGRL